MKAEELKKITLEAKANRDAYLRILDIMISEAKAGNHLYKTSGLNEFLIKRFRADGYTIEHEEQTSGEVIQYIIWR